MVEVVEALPAFDVLDPSTLSTLSGLKFDHVFHSSSSGTISSFLLNFDLFESSSPPFLLQTGDNVDITITC